VTGKKQETRGKVRGVSVEVIPKRPYSFLSYALTLSALLELCVWATDVELSRFRISS